MIIRLDGLKSVISALDKVEKKYEKALDKEIQGAALRTVAVAKSRLQPLPGDSRDVATDIGAVRQSINHTYDPSTHTAGIFAGNVTGDHMAAYLEFGTGNYAKRYVAGLSEPFRLLAKRFYVNGKGRLPEHPYLIPAYMQEGKRLSERLKNLRIGW